MAAQVRAAQRLCVPLQICHGDLWQDHVLFRGAQVIGLVDFGAMRVDTRASDIARLLGSCVPDDAPSWHAALEAYEQREPLTAAERELIVVLDRSAVLLSGLNWLKWLLLERRQFGDQSRVRQRLAAIIHRIRSCC